MERTYGTKINESEIEWAREWSLNERKETLISTG